MFVALGAPSSALAGTYIWNLANDFNTSAPANPDPDQYGDTPWSYQESKSGSESPGAFSLLPRYAVSGGLAEWGDPNTGALVGLNSSTRQIVVDSGVTPGQLVAVGWTSPFSQPTPVSVYVSVNADADYPFAACTSSVETQSGASFASGETVSPGGSIFVTVDAGVGLPGVGACDVSLQIEANGAIPAVTITQPVPGSTTTAAEPTFSGAAANGFGDGSQVTLNVYSGAAVSGKPVQTLQVARSGATWSATLDSPLAVGTYTAQATQSDLAGDVGSSAPVKFSVAPASVGANAPQVTLNSPGSHPLTTSTPTLTGTAGTAASDQSSVAVDVFVGATAKGSPLRALTAPVSTSGQFSAAVTPGLADGTYTAVAVQDGPGGSIGSSAPQTFPIDTQASVLTLLLPTRGSRSDVARPVFSGGAGTAAGDSGMIAVSLYRGTRAAGKALRTLHIAAAGSTWSVRWPVALRPAVYTARASQSQAAGRAKLSSAHTFRILLPPPVIGGALTIDAAGRVRLKIGCDEPPGDTCSGSVLVLTQGTYEPLPGGPVGRLTVMFANVKVVGGHALTITQTTLPRVTAALRRHASVPVTISANLLPTNGKAIHATARENLQRLGA